MALLALLLAPLAAHAEEEAEHLELQTTTIRATREVPKVMAVVPWKKALPADLGGRPIHSLVENLLEPLDPEVLRLQLEYYEQLFASKEAAAQSAAVDESGDE